MDGAFVSRVLTAACASGLLGAATLVLSDHLHGPWGILGDSFAVWCLVMFVAGLGASRLPQALISAAVSGIALNIGYYAALIFLAGRGDHLAVAIYWFIAAVPAALIMGGAAHGSQRAHPAWAVLAALPGAVFVFEVLPSANLHSLSGPTGQAVFITWVAVGVIATLAVTRRASRAVIALLALPLAVLGAGICWQQALSLFISLT